MGVWVPRDLTPSPVDFLPYGNALYFPFLTPFFASPGDPEPLWVGVGRIPPPPPRRGLKKTPGGGFPPTAFLQPAAFLRAIDFWLFEGIIKKAPDRHHMEGC